MNFLFRSLMVTQLFAAVLFLMGSAIAQETPAADDEFAVPAAEQPFWESAQQFLDAYANRDAEAIGQLFTPDAEFLDELGVRTNGRENIVKRFQQAFDGASTALIESITIENVRYLSEDVAIEEGIVVASPAPDEARSQNRYAAVHKKEEDGVWRIAILKDFPREELGRDEQLAQLYWMIGDWVNEDSTTRVHTECQLEDSGNYLLRQFTIRTNDGRELTGTQRNGWDPIHKKLRSWTFDSEGGFFSGFWTKTSDGWLLTSAGVNASGETVTSTAVYQIIDAEMLTWQYTNLIIGETVISDLPSVTMVRRPPAPQFDDSASE